MNHTIWTRSTLILFVALAVPVVVSAQAHSKAIPPASMDNLTSQEREILAYATDLAQQCASTMEKWVSNKEVSEDKLMGSFYYPIPNTYPPKYNTDWDRLSDRDILPLEESMSSKSAAIVYAIIVDRNGYIPTHISRYALPLTGNPAVDLVNNRTKMLSQHQVAWAAAHNTAPFLIQRYHRDTGENMAELSVPVFVHGVHWGAIRIAYNPTSSP
jgi:hypothetical protein